MSQSSEQIIESQESDPQPPDNHVQSANQHNVKHTGCWDSNTNRILSEELVKDP